MEEDKVFFEWFWEMEKDKAFLKWFWERYECKPGDCGMSIEEARKSKQKGANGRKRRFFERYIDGKDINDINAHCAWHESFIHKVTRRFDIEELKWLLDVDGIKIDVLDQNHQTALDVAFSRRITDAVKLLLSYGAKTYACPPTHWTWQREMKKMLDNYRTYLPRWNRFNTATRYNKEFCDIAIAWLLCCKRLNVFPKDIQYLIVEYIAEVWKLEPGKDQYMLNK